MMGHGIDLLAHALVGISRNPNLSVERAEVRVSMVIEQYFHLTSDGVLREQDRAGSISGTPKAPGVGAGLLQA